MSNSETLNNPTETKQNSSGNANTKTTALYDFLPDLPVQLETDVISLSAGNLNEFQKTQARKLWDQCQATLATCPKFPVKFPLSRVTIDYGGTPAYVPRMAFSSVESIYGLVSAEVVRQKFVHTTKYDATIESDDKNSSIQVLIVKPKTSKC